MTPGRLSIRASGETEAGAGDKLAYYVDQGVIEITTREVADRQMVGDPDVTRQDDVVPHPGAARHADPAKTEAELATIRQAAGNDKFIDDVLKDFEQHVERVGAGLVRGLLDYRNLSRQLWAGLRTQSSELADVNSLAKAVQFERDAVRSAEARRTQRNPIVPLRACCGARPCGSEWISGLCGTETNRSRTPRKSSSQASTVNGGRDNSYTRLRTASAVRVAIWSARG